MEERSRIRAKLPDSKSERIRERNQKEYDAMNKIVKKNARRDKRAFADQLAKEAEEAANKRGMGALHKITQRLCGTRQKCSTAVRDREGRILTTNREQTARWVEHFKSVLNQHCPLNTVILPPASKDLEISVGTPTVKEVKDAIRSLKNGKALTQFMQRCSRLTCQHLLESFPPFSMKCGNVKKYQKIGGRV